MRILILALSLTDGAGYWSLFALSYWLLRVDIVRPCAYSMPIVAVIECLCVCACVCDFGDVRTLGGHTFC